MSSSISKKDFIRFIPDATLSLRIANGRRDNPTSRCLQERFPTARIVRSPDQSGYSPNLWLLAEGLVIVQTLDVAQEALGTDIRRFTNLNDVPLKPPRAADSKPWPPPPRHYACPAA